MGCIAKEDGGGKDSTYFEDLRDVDWVEGPNKVPDSHASDEHVACIPNAESQPFVERFVREELRAGSQYLHVRVESDTAVSQSTSSVDITAITANIDPERYHVRALSKDTDTPKDLLASFEDTIAELCKADTTTVVTADMASFLTQLSGQELLEYETRLNETCRNTDTIVLSLYDRSRIPAATISDLLQAYPYVVTEGVVCCNPEYVSPEQFFSEDRATYRLDRTLEALTDRTRTNERIAELERQNDRLRVFANSIAHDLRNPLQTAIGRAELLPSDNEQAQVLQDALDRMEELVQDGLQMVHEDDLSDSEEISVRDLAIQSWDLIDVQDADLTVTEDFVVTGDRSRLRQLFENLYKNSVQHAGESPSIRVGPVEKIHFATRAEGDESYAGFYVEDDGPGIPKARRDEVFELGETGGDGTGYGLAIVKKIVEAHGWSIHISTSGDGGARFEITGVDAYPRSI